MKIKKPKNIFKLSFNFLLIFAACFFACKSKENGNTPTTIGGEVAPVDADDFAFLSRLPQDTIGFYYWNYDGAAYKKLDALSLSQSLESSASDFGSMIKDVSPTVSELEDALKSAGININDKAFLRSKAEEGAIFLAPYSEATNSNAGAPKLVPSILVKSANKLSELISRAEDSFREKKVKYQNISDGETKGVDIEISVRDRSCQKGQSNCPVSVEHAYIVAKGDLGAFSSNKDMALKLVSGAYNSRPQLLDGEAFKVAIKQLPKKDARLGVGYFDVKRLMHSNDPKSSSVAALSNLGSLKAASLVYSFDNAPRMVSRVVLDAQSKDVSWLPQLGMSSQAEMWKLAPERSLAVINGDGSLLRAAMSNLKSPKDSSANAIEKSLSSITRFQIAARVAPAGQSLLPVPDLTVAVGTSDIEGVKKLLMDQLGAMIGAQAGAKTMKWNDSTIDGKPVKMILTPLGIGAFIASNGGYVIITTTEAQMKQALSGGSGASTNIDTKLVDEAKSPTVAGIFIDYREVANLLESMSGVLSMYAPAANQGELNKIISPEKLGRLKNGGQNLINLIVEPIDSVLVITSDFSKVVP